MTNPRVLFLDEPTSGLDSFTANEVRAKLSASKARLCALVQLQMLTNELAIYSVLRCQPPLHKACIGSTCCAVIMAHLIDGCFERVDAALAQTMPSGLRRWGFSWHRRRQCPAEGAGPLQVMSVVKGLMKTGMTICATIHSPTPFCFRLFDRMMILLRGHMAYAGPNGALFCSVASPMAVS